MPTKTGAKIRIIVLGTGPEAEEARSIADGDDDVSVAAKFTKTVTHLVVDDTVKPSEPRIKKAEEAGVPVLKLAELKDLLAGGDTPEPAAEAEPEKEAEPEPAAEAEPEPAPEPAAEAEKESEPEPAAEPESEPERAVPSQAEAPKVEKESETDAAEATAEESGAEEAPAHSPKPGFMARIKSIFGMSGAKK
ncbi:hypothetical protein [Glycomyces xiaoerkulensis]|uniref:hypothetical protein n=1 Tax=Glycomyces xiaoerkulensis TaxID=2038139 RepID=UPI000C264443|nr:hypothetical protein [Glycomyces xiaoerkulensis]